MLKRTKKRTRRAFTLLEVLMVVVIIGVLAAFVVPQFINQGDDAKKKLAAAAVKSGLNGAIDLFRQNMERYPATLAELVNKPENEDEAKKWVGPYVKQTTAMKDPWDNDFIYQAPGEFNSTTYDLSSAGPDRQPNTEDDIRNWDTAR